MRNLKNLGKALSKTEQQTINGGKPRGICKSGYFNDGSECKTGYYPDPTVGLGICCKY